MVRKKVITRRVFLNKKTGQPSITLSKKKLLKMFGRVPKQMKIRIEGVEW